MTDVAIVVRQSQGTDDSISLSLQRDRTESLAADLGDDDPVWFDFGVHTGFSIHSRSREDERIDAHPRMNSLVDQLRAAEFDHLVAWDDTRIARDAYFREVERAAKVGDCDLRFVGDVERDSLAFSVQRVVETEVKREEIKKAKAAVRERRERGCWEGRAPYGLQYGPDDCHLVPDDEFETVRDVLLLRDRGLSIRDVAERTGVAKSTVGRILNRRGLYETAGNRAASNDVLSG